MHRWVVWELIIVISEFSTITNSLCHASSVAAHLHGLPLQSITYMTVPLLNTKKIVNKRGMSVVQLHNTATRSHLNIHLILFWKQEASWLRTLGRIDHRGANKETQRQAAVVLAPAPHCFKPLPLRMKWLPADLKGWHLLHSPFIFCFPPFRIHSLKARTLKNNCLQGKIRNWLSMPKGRLRKDLRWH